MRRHEPWPRVLTFPQSCWHVSLAPGPPHPETLLVPTAVLCSVTSAAGLGEHKDRRIMAGEPCNM